MRYGKPIILPVSPGYVDSQIDSNIAEAVSILTTKPLLDRFIRNDTSHGIGVAESGHVWSNDFQGKIDDGRLVGAFEGAGSVYPRTHLGKPCVRQSGIISFNGTATASGMTFITGPEGVLDLTPQGALKKMAHLLIAPTGYALSLWDGVDPLTVSPAFSGLSNTHATDGTTYVEAVNWDDKNNCVTLEVQDGTMYSWDVEATGYKLSDFIGPVVIFQVLLGASDSRLHGWQQVAAEISRAALANLVTNPYAAVDLTGIAKIIGNETHTRTKGAAKGGGTFVRVAVSGANAFQGVSFTGGAPANPSTVQPLAGGVYLRGAVGGEVVDVALRAVYSDASISQTTRTVTLTTEWTWYGPLPFKTTSGKTTSSTALLVLQDSSAPNPAITFDAAGATIVNGLMVP